jgi:hypothetical protein
MPRGHIEGSEIFVDKQECKTLSLGFCGLIMKYWLWQQLHPFELYYYMHNSHSTKIQLKLLFY